MKALCKILARRVEEIIIINNRGRQGFHNVKRVLNILHSQKGAQDTAFLSIDAEKAFDRVEWLYHFEILDRFGLGGNFGKWIKLLYTDPYAEVVTNSNISKPFKVQRGCRQGDPLSPLLFIVAIEPLAIAVRTHKHISGIKIVEQEQYYMQMILLFS